MWQGHWLHSQQSCRSAASPWWGGLEHWCSSCRGAPLPIKPHRFQLHAWCFGETSGAQQIHKLCWNVDNLRMKWSRRCKFLNSCLEQSLKAVSSKDSWWLSSAVDNWPCLGMQDAGWATSARSCEIFHVTGGTARPCSQCFPIPQIWDSVTIMTLGPRSPKPQESSCSSGPLLDGTDRYRGAVNAPSYSGELWWVRSFPGTLTQWPSHTRANRANQEHEKTSSQSYHSEVTINPCINCCAEREGNAREYVK